LEFEPANGSRLGEWRWKAFARLHTVHPKRQDPESPFRIKQFNPIF
jgi:hypothetical protein